MSKEKRFYSCRHPKRDSFSENTNIIYVLVDLNLFGQCYNQCLYGENPPFDKKQQLQHQNQILKTKQLLHPSTNTFTAINICFSNSDFENCH